MSFEILSDVENAFCVGSYISAKSLVQIRSLFIKRLGWDQRKLHIAPSNANISKSVVKFK